MVFRVPFNMNFSELWVSKVNQFCHVCLQRTASSQEELMLDRSQKEGPSLPGGDRRLQIYISGRSLIWGELSAWAEAGEWMRWPMVSQPYLLLHVFNLRAQPLYHPVQLRNLHPGGAEVFPMPAGRPLQLLVLGVRRRRRRGGEARKWWLPRAQQGF